jgi:hypothetical protein
MSTEEITITLGDTYRDGRMAPGYSDGGSPPVYGLTIVNEAETFSVTLPANCQGYIQIVHDGQQETDDVIDWKAPYQNTADFPAPWGFWKMEEASGDRLDSSGNNRTLSEVNGTLGNTTGIIGNAVLFDFGNKRLSRSEAWDPTSDKHFMMAVWLKRGATAGMIEINSNFGLYYEYASGPAKNWISAWTDGQYLDTGTADIDPATRHLIVLYYDGTGLYLEVDNVAKANDADTSSGFASNYNVTYIGNSLVGDADEFGIWEGAAADAAIARRAELWNGGAGRSLF